MNQTYMILLSEMLAAVEEMQVALTRLDPDGDRAKQAFALRVSLDVA